jgi:ubiquinone/menaquinone biosynthesis C-methylase UbiE
VKSQFAYLIEHLPRSDGPIVDLASGRCYLVEEFLRALQRPIVASDLSVPVLKRDRRYLEFWGLYDRVSLLAFDARCTPFRDGAVETMTTFVGLQSIGPPGNILSELRRVVSRKLLAISMFLSEGDDIHAPVIRQAGLETTLFRAPALKAFAESGWHAQVANAHLVEVCPTPPGVLLQGFKVDRFPLAETTQESCVIVAH